jgi:hypothetical protein
MRMGLALILIADLINRSTDLTAFYTDNGVLPRWALLEQFISRHSISLYTIGGEAWFVATLFILAGLFAVCLFVGYRTRLMTILSWIMLVSLHVRNPMVLDAGDGLLRNLLFWSMFLPLGARFSIDALIGRHKPSPNRFLSAAGIALMVQLCVMYALAALYKSDPIWRDGYGIFYALQIDQFATPLGHWLLQFPTMLRAMSFSVWHLELIGPFLLLMPTWNARVRIAVVLAFWSLHIGMGSTLELGHFPYICAAMWAAFLPAPVWDSVLARLTPHFQRAAQWLRQRLRPITSYLYIRPHARPAAINPTFINSLIVTCCMVYVLLINVRAYNPEQYAAYFPDKLLWFAELTWVDQQWNMFAPRPMRDDGWYIIPAKLRNGREVDLFTNGGPISFDKPQYVSRTYPNTRWRKYMVNLWQAMFNGHRIWYARYLTHQWNSTHPYDRQAEYFRIYFMLQPTTETGVRPPPERVMIWQHWCFGKPADGQSN